MMQCTSSVSRVVASVGAAKILDTISYNLPIGSVKGICKLQQTYWAPQKETSHFCTNTRSNQIHHNYVSVRFSSSSSKNKSYKLLIVGGGAGGCSTAAKFAKKLGKGKVGVIEPAEVHYYQPMWTLVGGGLKRMEQSRKPMADVLPKEADWIKSSAVKFDADNCKVTTADNDEISYEYLVIAVGLQLRFDQIKGFPEALETPGICSNYHPSYVTNTHKCMKDFKNGNAIFTFPKPPIKCPGAPQKIMYITERHLKKNGKRDGANVIYHTALPVLFGVKVYADALWKVVESRNIEVNLNSALVEVNPDKKEAIFENIQSPEKIKTTVAYEMLHVSPPMSAPECLRENAPGLTDASGFVDVNKETLQHVTYKNVFALGDCSSVPTSKTAAAVAGESGILRKNLTAIMDGKSIEDVSAKYDGYTACPLVTGPGECILAEFDFSTPPKPLETFPFDQAKPMWSSYQMKAHIMPEIYWQMLKGRWEGPRIVRKAFHLGMSR